MKNCAFQYADCYGFISEDTDLITYQEALCLWDKYTPKFKEDVRQGRNPEMAIWINMPDKDTYRETAKHWCGEDFEIIDNELYMLVPVKT